METTRVADIPQTLHDAPHNVRPLSLREFSTPPVIVAFVPRGAGCTTLLGSLVMQCQRDLGLEGVVILTDRESDHKYMGGIGGIVRNMPADEALRKMKEHQERTAAGGYRCPRLALVLDDVLYDSKLLRSAQFQCDLKSAKDNNIMVVIATSNISALPLTIPVFATHVMTTRTVSTEDPKLLQKRMFTMIDNHVRMTQLLSLCQSHEFLVGILRPTEPAKDTIDFLRTYTPTYYVRSNEWISDAVAWHREEDKASPAADTFTTGTFAMQPALVTALQTCLSTTAKKP